MDKFYGVFTGNRSSNNALLRRCLVLGMIHVRALPGTPRNDLSIDQVVDKACQEAEVYKKHNLDGVLVENMHDVPYLRNTVGPEIVSSMTRVCSEVKRTIGTMPLGVQILAGANKEAMAVASVVGGQFVRVEGFVYSHVADEGWMDACAGELLRYRRNIDAKDILVFTDVKKKHSSHSVTKDLSLIEVAKGAEYFGSDGIILTGSETGDPPSQEELADIRSRLSVPIIIGSGMSDSNILDYAHAGADAMIIGSFFKEDGLWYREIDESRIGRLMNSLP